jgi:hypothetical protein
VALDFLVALRVVIVGEFITRLHTLAGNDPDDAVDDIAVTVGLTRVVDKPRDVSIHVGVNHPSLVDTKTPDLTTTEIAIFSVCALLRRNLLTVVRDDPLVLIDVLTRENSPPVQGRALSTYPRQIYCTQSRVLYLVALQHAASATARGTLAIKNRSIIAVAHRAQQANIL